MLVLSSIKWAHCLYHYCLKRSILGIGVWVGVTTLASTPQFTVILYELSSFFILRCYLQGDTHPRGKVGPIIPALTRPGPRESSYLVNLHKTAQVWQFWASASSRCFQHWGHQASQVSNSKIFSYRRLIDIGFLEGITAPYWNKLYFPPSLLSFIPFTNFSSGLRTSQGLAGFALYQLGP